MWLILGTTAVSHAAASNAAQQAPVTNNQAVTRSGPKKPLVSAPRTSTSRTPEMNKTLHNLRGAILALQHDTHDYGGHRAKALGHLNAALQELNLALGSTKPAR